MKVRWRLTDVEGSPAFPSDANPNPSQNASEIARLTAEIAELRSEVRALHASIDARRQTDDDRVDALVAETAPTRRSAIRSHPIVTAIVPAGVSVGAMRSAARWTQALPAVVKREVVRGQDRREWEPPHRWFAAIAAVVIVTAVAFALRGVDLRGIPAGMHGDEAATGIEARRIIDTGWIGVYSGIAGGNPTGIYYLATIPISLVHDPVVAVRLLSAVIGAAAVVALFVLALRNAGFGSAVVASLLLAFSEWHIQFSRIGFVTGDWPTFVLIGVVFLAEGIRSRRWWWWAAAGAVISGATYVYNGNGPLLLVVAAFAVWTLFGWRGLFICGSLGLVLHDPSLLTALPLIVSVRLAFHPRFRDRTAWVNFASYAVSSLVILKGMIDFIRAHPHDYFGRAEDLSVFKTDQWRAQTGILDRARFLLDRYELVWNRITFHPIPNGADLSGVTPLIPKLTLAIFLIGLVVALIRRPTPVVLLSTAIVVAMPLAPALTDLTLRRALVIAPFLSLLGAIGMIELLRLAFRGSRGTGIAGAALLTAVLALSSYANYNDFFNKTIPSGPVRAVFALELRRSADYMQTLSPDAYVYLYSQQWGLRYDVLKLIVPDIRGEDRLPVWGGSGGYDVDWTKGQPVFIFIGAQAADLPQVKARYPHGTEVVGPSQGAPLNGPSYVAYIPDKP
jgi:hypothetical protein